MVNLALGTVQFGIDYGVANSGGKPSVDAAQSIIEAALNGGVNWIDTAMLYGNAEEVVGHCLSKIDSSLSQKAKVVTKMPSIKDSSQKEIDAWLDQSLQALKRDSVDGLMLHDELDLAQADTSLVDHFFQYAATDKVSRVGASIYTVEQAEKALEFEGLGMMQLPSNLFDRSFVDAGIFRKCKERGVTVFVRSIFLQGLFFLKPENEKVKRITGASKALTVLHQFCAEHECSVAELCFADATRFDDAMILTGVDKISQLEDNFISLKNSKRIEKVINKWDAVRPEITKELINPSLWNLK